MQLRIKKTKYSPDTNGKVHILSSSEINIVVKVWNVYKNKAHTGNNMKRLCRHLPLKQFMNEFLSQDS